MVGAGLEAAGPAVSWSGVDADEDDCAPTGSWFPLQAARASSPVANTAVARCPTSVTRNP